jgi:hypothetical protein
MYRIARISSTFRDSKGPTLATGQEQYNYYNQKDRNQSHKYFSLLGRAAMTLVSRETREIDYQIHAGLLYSIAAVLFAPPALPPI